MIFSKRRSVKGFTLTELIVVIAIIGILLAVLMPTMSGYYWKSRVRSANANAKIVYNAMQTEVQKYLSIDRHSSTSTFGGTVLLKYDGNGNVQFINVAGTAWANIDASTPNGGAYQSVCDAVNRTVSGANGVAWAVLIDNYIVKSAVAAPYETSPHVGFYTKGTITIDHPTNENFNQRAEALLRDKRTVYDTSS